MNYYISLKIRNEKDENRSRWATWKPWKEFIEGIGQLKLSMRPAPRTLEQKKLWIEKFVAPTLKMIQLADDNLGEDFLKHVMDETTLKEKQKKIVEDYLFGRLEIMDTCSLRRDDSLC